MSDKKWTIPEDISQESKDWAKREGFQLIGVICKGGREYQVVVCPVCECPRLVDYACDTCAKRDMESTYKEFEKQVSEFRIFLNQI